MTPLLLLFGYPAQIAIGTDLVYAAVTKVGGVLAYHRYGNVDWRLVGKMAAGSIPMSILCHTWLQDANFQASSDYESALTLILGLMLIVTSLVLIYNEKYLSSMPEREASKWLLLLRGHRNLVTLLMGMLLGICVTLSSVGAGAFGTAILLTIYNQTGSVRLIGTDIAHAVPLTFFAGMGYFLAGFVDFMLLTSLLIGSLPAIRLGSKVSGKVPERALRRMLTLLLLLLGSYYSLVFWR